MKRKTAISFFLVFFVTASVAYAEEWVTFKGTSKTESALTLKGILNKPEGEGPFPAVVMLHSCAGIEGMPRKHLDTWAQRLAGWGYVSLMVDSLGPRGESDICDRVYFFPPSVRAQDAHDSKSYLTELSFVDKNKIALMGWSHGGWATLMAIYEKLSIQNRGDPFRCAIAFYPYCNVELGNLNSPLLILIGELDDWCPAQMCFGWMPSGKTTHEVTLKIYPEAYHSFDFEGADEYKEGHRILYNPEAANDAIEQVKQFLAKYVK
jgi:dienelactone hydrolase